MSYTVEEIVKRHKAAQAKKELFRDLYEDAY